MAKKQPTKPKKAVRKSDAAGFEQLLTDVQTAQSYQLRLYVTGTTPRSTQAIKNIRSLCEKHLKGRYDLEVIDIYQQPEAAVGQQIIAAPTLVKELPLPIQRMIGNLSDHNKVIVSLNLASSDLEPADKE